MSVHLQLKVAGMASHGEAGEGEKGTSPEPSEGVQPHQQLDSRLVESGTVGKQISAACPCSSWPLGRQPRDKSTASAE